MLLLLSALTLHADDLRPGTRQLSIFVSDPSYTSSSSGGSNLSGGAGLALSWVWAPRWSTELAISAQQNRENVTLFVPLVDAAGNTTIAPVTAREQIRTYPFEILTRYHFTNDSRWTPFVGAGLRYVGEAKLHNVQLAGIPAQPPPLVIPDALTPVTATSFRARTSGEVAAGVSLGLSRSVSLKLEARRLLRSDSVAWDPVTRAVIGVSWKF
jgi:outer membrane protein W